MGSSPSTQHCGYDQQLEGFFLAPLKSEEETVDMPWVDLLERSSEYPFSAPTSMEDDPLRCLFNSVEEAKGNILDDLTRFPLNKGLTCLFQQTQQRTSPCFSPFHQHMHQTSWDCDLRTSRALASSPCWALFFVLQSEKGCGRRETFRWSSEWQGKVLLMEAVYVLSKPRFLSLHMWRKMSLFYRIGYVKYKAHVLSAWCKLFMAIIR